jgi:hypothetical protein
MSSYIERKDYRTDEEFRRDIKNAHEREPKIFDFLYSSLDLFVRNFLNKKITAHSRTGIDPQGEVIFGNLGPDDKPDFLLDFEDEEQLYVDLKTVKPHGQMKRFAFRLKEADIDKYLKIQNFGFVIVTDDDIRLGSTVFIIPPTGLKYIKEHGKVFADRRYMGGKDHYRCGVYETECPLLTYDNLKKNKMLYSFTVENDAT